MAMTKTEITEWLDTLPDDAEIGVDDGGLCLRVVDDPEPWLEIGGMPEGEEDNENP
jgi:hypothetical protein